MASLRDRISCLEQLARNEGAKVTLHRQAIAQLEQQLRDRDDELEILRSAPPGVVPRDRERLPDTRASVCVKLRINSQASVRHCEHCGQPAPDSPKVTSLHLHLGFYDDGRLGECFIRLDRGSRYDAMSSFADEWATALSYSVQHGLDVEWLLQKARYVHDTSAGVPFVWSEVKDAYVPHPTIRHCSSVVDYIAAIIERVLAGKPAAAATPDETNHHHEGSTPS